MLWYVTWFVLVVGAERRVPVTPSSSSSSSSRYQRRRSTGSRDERYRSGEITAGLWLPKIFQNKFDERPQNCISHMLKRIKKSLSPSDVHSEAVQAALERHSERKMAVLLPSKRRSLMGQTSMDTYTPPGVYVLISVFNRTYVHVLTSVSPCDCADSSSGSDAEGSLGRAGGVNVDSWINRALHGSPSTSSSSSSHSNSSVNAARLAETSMHSYGSKSVCKYTNLQVIHWEMDLWHVTYFLFHSRSNVSSVSEKAGLKRNGCVYWQWFCHQTFHWLPVRSPLVIAGFWGSVSHNPLGWIRDIKHKELNFVFWSLCVPAFESASGFYQHNTWRIRVNKGPLL